LNIILFSLTVCGTVGCDRYGLRFGVLVKRPPYPWLWSAMHRYFGGLGQNCPHTKIRSKQGLSIPSVISRQRQHLDSDILDRRRWSGRYGLSPLSGRKSGNSRRSSRSETSRGFRKSWNSNRAEGSVGSGKLVWSYWSTSANSRESGVSAAFGGVGSTGGAG